MRKLRRKLNRLNDAYVKYVFARQERKHITQSFVNAFFEAEGTPQLVDFEFRDRELDAERQGSKLSRLDLLGSCSDGTLVNVEIQVDRLEAMPERTLFYWTWLYRRLMRGEDYGKLRRTVCIDVLAFDLFSAKESTDWRNCFSILNKRHPSHSLTDHLEIHFVELPKWERTQPKKREDMSRLDKWLAYFSGKTSDEEMEAIAMSDPMIQEALEAENAFVLDPVMLSAYDAAEAARRDQAARENYVRNEGRREGQKEGRKEGELALARSLLALGTVSIENIQKATGWDKEQIEALKRNDKNDS